MGAVASGQLMLGAPAPAQRLALAGEPLARRPAFVNPIGAEMAEAFAHLAPGREHDHLDVIEDGQRFDGPLAARCVHRAKRKDPRLLPRVLFHYTSAAASSSYC